MEAHMIDRLLDRCASKHPNRSRHPRLFGYLLEAPKSRSSFPLRVGRIPDAIVDIPEVSRKVSADEEAVGLNCRPNRHASD